MTTYSEADCDPCELLLAAYGFLGGHDGDVQAMRDRLTEDWGDMPKVRTMVGLRLFKEQVDAARLAEGLRRAGTPEY